MSQYANRSTYRFVVALTVALMVHGCLSLLFKRWPIGPRFPAPAPPKPLRVIRVNPPRQAAVESHGVKPAREKKRHVSSPAEATRPRREATRAPPDVGPKAKLIELFPHQALRGDRPQATALTQGERLQQELQALAEQARTMVISKDMRLLGERFAQGFRPRLGTLKGARLAWYNRLRDFRPVAGNIVDLSGDGRGETMLACFGGCKNKTYGTDRRRTLVTCRHRAPMTASSCRLSAKSGHPDFDAAALDAVSTALAQNRAFALDDDSQSTWAFEAEKKTYGRLSLLLDPQFEPEGLLVDDESGSLGTTVVQRRVRLVGIQR